MNIQRTEKWCLLFVLLLFTLLPLIRLYPYTNNLGELLMGTDDWNFYAKNALEIKRGGFLLPHFREAYSYPGGFFYNYFVATCFAVFGENVIPVYIVQSILLGCSVVLVFLSFRNRLRPLMRYAFLLCLVVFALLDVSKDYSMRLLSENLAVFTIAAFVYSLFKALRENKLLWQVSTLFFLLVSVLTRPVILPFGLVFVVFLFVYYWKDKKISLARILLFSLFILTGISAIAIRNYLICGQWVFFPTLGVYGSGLQMEQLSVMHLVRKILFMFGYLPALSAEYRIRPHWMLLWAGYFVYLFFSRKTFRSWAKEEMIVHVFLLVYCGLSVFFVTVDSYGFRAFIPVTLLVLPFSWMALDMLMEKRPKQGQSL